MHAVLHAQLTRVRDRQSLLGLVSKKNIRIQYTMGSNLGIRTVCRAPTNHFYDKPLPPLPYGDAFDIEVELVPKPLFSRPTVLPPTCAAYAVVEPQSPIYIPSVSSANISRTSSLQSSRRSTSSSVSSMSTPLSSAPTSPYCQRRSLELTCTSPSTVWYTPILTPEPQPRRILRRRVSPTHDTLRGLRAKESDACLQKICDEQVAAYLSGSLWSRAKFKRELAAVEDH
ncbi:hypothetical protein C7974DRAFT_13451 [Boeremia exigua]|uniref:uncharacterized protein n=1 Tax=Boeremia exigua TaxID=749465 RepID=UPI001E8D4BF2|nr:uncharacterized protein C7974DRAFT_13451 [Boeremia exigua]KAH6644059.1 hypothetical protein C7974DRAFT_13451 [Boeremia exigua]